MQLPFLPTGTHLVGEAICYFYFQCRHIIKIAIVLGVFIIYRFIF